MVERLRLLIDVSIYKMQRQLRLSMHMLEIIL